MSASGPPWPLTEMKSGHASSPLISPGVLSLENVNHIYASDHEFPALPVERRANIG
jgi:hypothetical protein